jgi:hypothetical protein
MGDRITVYWEKDRGGKTRNMANGTQPGQSPEQRQAWLTEYQVCQQHVDSIGSQIWVSTTIFLTINVALLGGLVYTLMRNLGSSSLELRLIILISFIALSIGIILILNKWVNWLERMRFRTAINFEREYELEALLGMRRHTMCRERDEEYDALKASGSAKIKEFQERNKHFKYFRASGFDGLMFIAKTLMGLWSLSILVLLTVLIISL